MFKLPSLDLPENEKTPTDILDYRVSEIPISENLPIWLDSTFGTKLERIEDNHRDIYDRLRVNPPVILKNITLREAIAAYYQPVADIGLAVNVNSKTGAITLEDPAWKRVVNWCKTKLVDAHLMDP